MIEPKPPDQVRAEHQAHLLERYRGSARSFTRLLTVLVGFALAFPLIVLLPYISIQRAKYLMPSQIEALESQIAQEQQTIETYGKIRDGIERLQEAIRESPQRLRLFIRGLSGPQSELPPPLSGSPDELHFGGPDPGQWPVQQQWPGSPSPFEQVQRPLELDDPCASLDREAWVNCRVRQAVLDQFAEYRRIVKEDIVAPLSTLETSTFDLAAVEEGLRRLEEAFESKLKENPRFWETFTGKVGFSVELGEEVDRFWNEYGSLVSEQNREIENRLGDLEKAKTAVEKERKGLEAREEEVIARLSQIESPMGKLPVGLEESVLVFPILLAIGWLMCVSMLGETTRLRLAFHGLYQGQDPTRKIVSDEQVLLVAPLWIDPLSSEQSRRIRYLILAVPFVVFFLGCASVLYLWSLPNTFPNTGTLGRWVYAVLYLLGLPLFAFGFSQISSMARGYLTLEKREATEDAR